VARKLENAVAPLQGLKHIYTKVQDGTVTITTEFRLEKPVQEALDEVRSAVQSARADLPAEMRDPVLQKINLAGNAGPGLHGAIRCDGRGRHCPGS
jgi:multidrug efflux pump subunit AcrB